MTDHQTAARMLASRHHAVSQSGDASARAERNVQTAEQLVARQARIVEMLEKDDPGGTVNLARSVLETLRTSLEVTREHLRLQREARSP